MMQLDQAKSRAKTANKVALETEKEKDTAEKGVEELKRQIQPKRTHTHDAGDDHEMHAEVDFFSKNLKKYDLTRPKIPKHSLTS